MKDAITKGVATFSAGSKTMIWKINTVIKGLEDEKNQAMGNSATAGGVANVCQCGNNNVAGAKSCAKRGNKLF